MCTFFRYLFACASAFMHYTQRFCACRRPPFAILFLDEVFYPSTAAGKGTGAVCGKSMLAAGFYILSFCLIQLCSEIMD